MKWLCKKLDAYVRLMLEGKIYISYHSKICTSIVTAEIKTLHPTLPDVYTGESDEGTRDRGTGVNFKLFICAHCQKSSKMEDVNTRPWVFGEGRSLEGDKFTC